MVSFSCFQLGSIWNVMCFGLIFLEDITLTSVSA